RLCRAGLSAVPPASGRGPPGGAPRNGRGSTDRRRGSAVAADLVRCGWAAKPPYPEYQRYHDEEWGVPVHDDRVLFDSLPLEGAQAGLSWATILRKRPYYRQAFAGFDPAAGARFTAKRQGKVAAHTGRG